MLRNACIDHGFFYLTDHGIPAHELQGILEAASTFFALPLEEKLLVDYRKSTCNRGYEPMGAQTLQAGAAPDLKEGFYIGVDLPPDDKRVVAKVFNHGPNQWPFMPDSWQRTMLRYFEAMLELGALLMSGIALSLGLPEDYFAPYCRNPRRIVTPAALPAASSKSAPR